MLESLLTEIRNDRALVVAFVVVAIYLASAVLAPVLAPRDPNVQALQARLQPPSGRYIFGSDEFGRDVLSRVISATRSSMTVASVVVVLTGVIGTVVGIFVGYRGGFVDDLVMRMSDVLMAFPSLVLALALVAVLRPGVRSVTIALVVAYTPIYVRIVRGKVLSIKEEAYVEAARAIGVNSLTIAIRHILPNVMGPVLVQGALTFAFSVLAEAGLSFVGLGVQLPTASWGNIMASGRDYMTQAPWITISAGVATVIIVLALLQIADGMRDVLDPYQTRL